MLHFSSKQTNIIPAVNVCVYVCAFKTHPNHPWFSRIHPGATCWLAALDAATTEFRWRSTKFEYQVREPKNQTDGKLFCYSWEEVVAAKVSERLKMLGFVQKYGKVKRYVEHSNAAFDRCFEEFLNGKRVSFHECESHSMVRIVSHTPTGNYIMMTWKYQKMEHTLCSKISEWVTMKKFKVHDAGSIGSLGCNYCFRSSYSLQFLQTRSLFLLWIYYTFEFMMCCFYICSLFCFHMFLCTNLETKRCGSEMDQETNSRFLTWLPLGLFGNVNAKMASDFRIAIKNSK